MKKSVSINRTDGRKRVVITNIQPIIDCGKYPAKSAVGESLDISADIFTDGHDEIAANILVKKSMGKVAEFAMKFVANDKWIYTFTTNETGVYSFEIRAYIDHYATWRKNILKKALAGQNIEVEKQIGVNILTDAYNTVKAKRQQGIIDKGITLLEQVKNIEELEIFLNDNELNEVAGICKDKNMVTSASQVVTIEVERKKAAYSTWYELFPRSASANNTHGTFNDVKNLLPRIADMGFDVLYLPPIHPIGHVKRKGKNNSLIANEDDPGSPWAIGNETGGHMALHAELGNLKDFKNLIAAARKINIDIAMDIAFQCAPDHPYVVQHPEWFKWRPDGTVQYAENPPKKYEDILPINFETNDWQNLWLELKKIIEYWIRQGVSIFRIDNPHTKAFAFWEWVIKEIRTEHPETIFLAEAFTRPRLMEQLAKAGFNQSYTYFTWRNNKHELEEYIKELTKTELRYFFRPNFWPNTPDILPPEITYGGENAYIIRLLLAATLSSNYGIYGPVYEFGLTQPATGKEEYIDSEKYEIKHWDWNAETRISEIIKLVNSIRKQNIALQTTWNIEMFEATNEYIIAYGKRTGANILIMAVNLDPFNTQSAHIKIPAGWLSKEIGQTYKVDDLLSGDTYHWESEWNYVQLDPSDMPAHILKVETSNHNGE